MESLALLCYVLVLIVYVAYKLRADYGRAIIFKLIASAIFVAYACWNLAQSTSLPGGLTVLGLVLGLVGDYYLDMKYVSRSPSRSEASTFRGFYAFSVSHLLNIAAILSGADVFLEPTHLVLAFAFSMIVSASVVESERMCGLSYGKFKTISFLYGTLLMFATSVSVLTIQSDRQNTYFMCAGLVFFLASDLVLSQTFFGTGKGTAPYILANYFFYYTAQWLIAKSV